MRTKTKTELYQELIKHKEAIRDLRHLLAETFPDKHQHFMNLTLEQVVACFTRMISTNVMYADALLEIIKLSRLEYVPMDGCRADGRLEAASVAQEALKNSEK